MLKFLFSVAGAILFAFMFAAGASAAVGLPLMETGLTLSALSFIPISGVGSIAMAGVLKEVWTGEVIKALNNSVVATFLDGIRNFSKYVSAVGDEAQVIHAVYMGVEPDVLLNNTTYPIPVQELGAEDVVITLDKYQTKATPITDDELYALTYDKIAVVKDSHATAIKRVKFRKALHSLAPSGNTAAMPVLLTTGADDGTGRKRLQWSDLVALKSKCDDLEIPEEGRRLVLCTDHLNDMLLLDTKFKDQFYNSVTGKPYSALGFEFFSYASAPYYVPATKLKLAFGAVPAGTDRRASIFFSLERAAMANGWTKMYYSEAGTSPETQRNLVNFRHNFIVMPTREEGRGAIISANV